MRTPDKRAARRRRGAAELEEVMVLVVMLPLAAALFWLAHVMSDACYGIIRVCVLGPVL